jgi:anti-sigma B factor antagonist
MSNRNLSIIYREVQDGVILELQGPLTLGDPVEAFREHVHTLIAAGKKKLAINLAGVSYADSSGVGAMMGALTTAEGAGVLCKFFGASLQLQGILKHVGLENVLDLKSNEAAALADWKQG